jgi:hypothetical protein
MLDSWSGPWSPRDGSSGGSESQIPQKSLVVDLQSTGTCTFNSRGRWGYARGPEVVAERRFGLPKFGVALRIGVPADG